MTTMTMTGQKTTDDEMTLTMRTGDLTTIIGTNEKGFDDGNEVNS